MADTRRRHALQAGLALGTLLWLPRVQACEFETGTLRVTHPWARATGPGEDTAVLGMKLDEVTAADRLVLVQTPVAASAAIGGKGARPVVDLPIAVGQEMVLDEGGTYIQLIGLKHPLLPGREYPLVLGFEKSGMFEATVSVDYERFR
jgi:copper(I)-binding protein